METREQKYTSGPWVAEDGDVWQTTREMQSYPQKVAVIIAGRKVGEAAANARLIAAAPELAQALHDSIDDTQSIVDAWESGDLAGAVNIARANADLFRTVLDKAGAL